ncbi:MAG: nitroreductase family deazaflavin-dependent oxidoreductase [Chloroflexi bacterium]|nr:MAG: nitroreductase family deazaflavin-dependent oxidoreductase [Chloroflexota bacterium]TMF20987.1 MAG: nitroreductase family deazaflavin-dependent oxidoreductase [Chloroflexota bacterium]TMF95988.1 MAG: nitroreductase family deazaflavin-dependent oxidoreductase [Chloroflexota bacterium]
MADQSTKIYVPPKGTRGTRVMDFVFALMKPFAGREVKRYQKADGPEPKLFMGFPVLVLTTVGAKSGQERSTVLGGFPDGDNAWLIIASKGGSATHPGWFHNIAANPDKVWAQIGNRKFKVECKSLTGKEREDAYNRVASIAKAYQSYPTKTDREIPVLRLTPAS